MRPKVVAPVASGKYLGAIDFRWLSRVPPALLLAVAAGGKLRAIGWGGPSGEFPSWLIGVSIGELLLAWWLLSGARPRWAAATGLLTFLSFTFFSFSQGLLGKANCGCLGVVQASPWTMAILDGAMCICLIMSCYDHSEGAFRTSTLNETKRRMTKRIGSGWVALALVTAITVAAVVWLGEWVVGTAGDDFVLVQPAQWVGKAVDQIHDIPHLARLAKGNWYVLFFRDGCGECQQAKSEFIHKLMDYQRKGYRCASVRIPDSNAKAKAATPTSLPPDVYLISLPSNRKWIFRAPMYMTVWQGRICRVEWDGADFRHDNP